MSNKVYEIVTEKILENLEKGNVPWHKPWKSAYDVRMPHNLVSKKAYRGVNVWLLAFAPYESPYWLTFKQCQQLGGKVKKGEKSWMVVFWKVYDKEVETDEGTATEKRFILRYYNVFNTEQCEDLDLSKVQNETKQIDFNPIDECEAIIENMPNRPTITHNNQRAVYYQKEDKVNLPEKDSFDGEEEYYSTAFHELGHSTGHESRLNRFKKDDTDLLGNHSYSKEELVAEMTSAFLCGVAGIENKTIDNSAAYIKGWSKKFREDIKMVVEASQKAQKAADYILDKNSNEN